MNMKYYGPAFVFTTFHVVCHLCCIFFSGGSILNIIFCVSQMNFWLKKYISGIIVNGIGLFFQSFTYLFPIAMCEMLHNIAKVFNALNLLLLARLCFTQILFVIIDLAAVVVNVYLPSSNKPDSSQPISDINTNINTTSSNDTTQRISTTGNDIHVPTRTYKTSFVYNNNQRDNRCSCTVSVSSNTTDATTCPTTNEVKLIIINTNTAPANSYGGVKTVNINGKLNHDVINLDTSLALHSHSYPRNSNIDGVSYVRDSLVSKSSLATGKLCGN